MRGVGPSVIRALQLIHEEGGRGLTATDLAARLWPDSPYHRVSYKCGNRGSSKGRGLVKSAGSFLGKMRKLGLVEKKWHEFPKFIVTNLWRLTPRGEEVLRSQG